MYIKKDPSNHCIQPKLERRAKKDPNNYGKKSILPPHLSSKSDPPYRAPSTFETVRFTSRAVLADVSSYMVSR